MKRGNDEEENIVPEPVHLLTESHIRLPYNTNMSNNRQLCVAGYLKYINSISKHKTIQKSSQLTLKTARENLSQKTLEATPPPSSSTPSSNS